MDEKQLNKQIEEYQKIAKENKNVDVTMLMMSALHNADANSNVVSSKAKYWAYTISVGLPPFGFLFALYYMFSDKDDAKKVAYTCAGLTMAAVLLYYMLGKMVFSSAGTSVQQVEQITPQQIQQTFQ